MIDMKNLIKLLLGSFLLTSFLFSCKKDENKVYYENGTAPVLTASALTDLVLNRTNSANTAVTFTWTNPDYKFNTGISSQDVNYTLQIDTTGSNFANPSIQEAAISSALRLDLTVKDLNTYLTKLGLNDGVPYNVEFRLKSALANGSVALYSNVIKIKVTTYLDVAIAIPVTGELFITGNGVPSDWTNDPPANQKCIKVSNTEYYIIMSFTPGKYYKFLTTLTQWQPQYGLKPGSGGTGASGDLGLNPGGGSDPDAIPTPAVSGTYKVTLNFKTGKYTAVKL